MGRRRIFGALALLAAAAPAASTPAMRAILYAGSYTAGNSRGIYAWRFDSAAGSLSPLGLVAAAPQPAHIWIAPNRRFLYAVNWEQEGGVSAFRIDPKSGRLALLNRVSAQGAQPNQVVLDPRGRIAVTVTYNTGNVAAYRVKADGSLSEAFYVDQHAMDGGGAGPAMPRTHGIQFSADGRTMYVADLGLDRVYVYRVSADARTIAPAAAPYVMLHAGAGPRRMQIARDGRFLYVNHETDSEVSVFAVEGETLRETQAISTLPAGFAGRNTTAEIILSPDGRFLYVSNRGDDSIAVFAVDRASGRLALLADVPAGGRTPRNLRIDPSGDFLFSANENGGAITVFKIDHRTGALTRTAAKAAIDTPGGLYFLSVG